MQERESENIMEMVSQDEAANMSFPDEEPTIIDVEPEELTADSNTTNAYTADSGYSSDGSYSASEVCSTSDTTFAADSTPVWLDDKSVNEIIFCEEFLSEHRIICINNQFIGFDGVIEDIYIEKLIPCSIGIIMAVGNGIGWKLLLSFIYYFLTFACMDFMVWGAFGVSPKDLPQTFRKAILNGRNK